MGGWRLRRWTITHGDGRIVFPFGDKASGLILYTPDGAMSAIIAEAGRKALSSPSMKTAPEAERAHAFSSFFAYGGRFEIEDDEVVHHVTTALNPALVGTEQRRRMQFNADGSLTLSADEQDGQGGMRRHAIEWQR